MDFKAIHASTGAERKKYLARLDEAWSKHGAVYVINHSIGTEVIDEAFAWVSQSYRGLDFDPCDHDTNRTIVCQL